MSYGEINVRFSCIHSYSQSAYLRLGVVPCDIFGTPCTDARSPFVNREKVEAECRELANETKHNPTTWFCFDFVASSCKQMVRC